MVRAIRAARAAETVALVVVSTDDAEIAETAQSENALVIRRPAELAQADSSSESAVHHALTSLLTEGRILPTVTLLVQCTSPFIEPEDLNAVVRTIELKDADSCLTVSPTHCFLWREGESGEAVAINHDSSERLPRQQLAPQYRETGAVYGFRTRGFLEARSRFFGMTAIAVVDPHRTLEIDESFDLRLAERWLELLEEPRPPRGLPPTVEAVVFDFDGVMTDNRALVLSDGSEGVVVDRGDGLGLARLRREAEVAILVLSTEEDPVVRRRCDKLQVECMTGVADKALILTKWLDELEIDPSRCIYVGNDLNDLGCMELAGFSVAPSDAVPQIKDNADFVLAASGGQGAVRELIDLLFDGGYLKMERVPGDDTCGTP